MTPGFSPEAEKMGHHQGEGLQEEAGMTSLFEVPRDTTRTVFWSRDRDGGVSCQRRDGTPGESAQ